MGGGAEGGARSQTEANKDGERIKPADTVKNTPPPQAGEESFTSGF